MFRKISGVVIDATSGKTGIKTDNGVFTVSFSGAGKDVEHTVSQNLFDGLSFNVPGFASQVPFENVKAGDIVVGASEILGFVVGKTAKALKLADTRGMTKTYTPPKVELLGSGAGAGGVLVVQSLFSLTGSADGAAGLGASLLPLMLLGGDSGKLDKILPFLLMQGAAGGGAAAGGMNAMLPLLMLKGEGGLGGDMDPLTLMALTGGLGGGAGGVAANPLMLAMLLGKGDLFGGSDAPSLAPALSRVGTPQLRNKGSW